MKLFQRFPISSGIIIYLILPLIIVSSAVYLQLTRSLPQMEATLSFPALLGNVAIKRDEHGIAYIEAQSEQDIYFAMGFAHASDRLWQLEMQRRLVKGQLSEIFGSEFLRQDIWMKTLDLEKAAQSAWTALSNDAQASLTAYSAGINAWLSSQKQLPVEFAALSITPAPWTPIDSLAWSKMFALNLSGNMFSELTRAATKLMLPDANYNDIYPESVDSAAVYSENQDIAKLFPSFLSLKWFNESVLKNGGMNVGSNSWVISGQLSRSGFPILANDPHLGLQIPSLWYVVHQSSPDFQASGMSLVGLPLVIFGRNTDILWGGTNMPADIQDLYIEKINLQNPNLYLSHDGSWKKIKVITKKIKVKARFPAILREPLKPVSLDIRYTENGPIISDFDKTLNTTLSLKWTALLPQDTTYEAFFSITHAKDWNQFKSAASKFRSPVLNLLYADRKNIGYIGAGMVPVRTKGNGAIPTPGWDPQYHWKGYIPPKDMPQELNPSSGMIISANNDPTPKDYPYYISNEWALPLRAQRIKSLLTDALHKQGAADMQLQQKIQADQYDASLYALKDTLSLVKTDTPRQQTLISALKNWDGYMRPDSVAVLLIAVWVPELNKMLFDDEFSRSYLQAKQTEQLRSMLPTMPYTLTLKILHGETQADWCDNVATPHREGCTDILKRSFELSLNKLDKLLGKDIGQWSLGIAQHTFYEHMPFSQIRLLDRIFTRKISNSGGGNSINIAPSIFVKSEGLVQRFGSSFRQIMMAGTNDYQHLYMNSTGQSGNIFSRHYDDMIRPFNTVSYYSLPAEPERTLSHYQLHPER
ncbi:penicillin acylase family protein [Vibrio vulnificus]|uniref:penicillin acylase family protein n=1 Tax=Vibrio vulnificus TaxID=672 RepID=UPI00102956B3|nr:penicillin acylase family protein [Vibrio vulnificus]RZP95572.1 penicillin acylase family protein [Vibrio vulnificus]